MAGGAPGHSDRREGRSPAFTALDIGASKIACLIAADTSLQGRERPVDVIGVGRAPVRKGGKGGEPDAHARLIAVALDQARRMAGDEATPVGVAYGGPDIASTTLEGTVQLRKGSVSVADVASAIGAAVGALEPGRRVLHAAPMGYRIDGGESVGDPRGGQGEELCAEVCIVHAPEDHVALLETTLARAGVQPAFLVAAPFAAGYGVLTAQERDAGAIVLDLGEQSAGIAVFRQGGVTHAETIAGCGARLTLDLAARLKTTPAVAERAKLLYGGLAGDHDPMEALEIPVIGGDGRLEPGLALRGAIEEALRPRIEEILERLGARLASLGPVTEGLGVTLTGGVTQMSGLRPIAQRVLARPVRIAAPTGFAALDSHSNAYAAAAGLLRLGFERFNRAPAPREKPAASPPPPPVQVRRSMGEAVAWIKENF